ncbi:MAG TPA: DUF4097 family beta strand repeat-containing protein [Bacteroidia bacterium]
MSDSDKNMISDETLRELLQLNILLSDDHDETTNKLIQMEAKYALTGPGFIIPALPGETKLLDKLKHVSGKGIYYKWLFTGLTVAGISTATYLSMNKNTGTSVATEPKPNSNPTEATISITEPMPKKDTNTVQFNDYATPVPVEETPVSEEFKLTEIPIIEPEYSQWKDPIKENYKTSVNKTIPSTSGTFKSNNLSINIDTTFKNIEKLEVVGSFCSINVMKGSPGLLNFKGQINMSGKKPKNIEHRIKYEQFGNILRITVENTEKHKAFITTMNSYPEGVLSFVADPKIEMSLRNTSGNVYASGMEPQVFNIDCSYGNVTVEKMSTNVNVNAKSGDVNMRDVKGNVICNALYGNQTFSNVTGDMSIASSSGSVTMSNIEGQGMIVAKYGHVSITKMKGNVDVNSNSGNILLVDVKGFYTKLKSLYGNIDIKNLNSKLDIDSRSGDISITELAGETNINSLYGKQNLHNVTGDIKTVSKSGDINLNTCIGNLNIEAIYGNVSLTSCKGKITVNVSSGNISGWKVEVLEALTLTSNYGNIKMNISNPTEDLSFEIESPAGSSKIVSGTLTLEKEYGTLVHKNGKILIHSYTKSGNQFFD